MASPLRGSAALRLAFASRKPAFVGYLTCGFPTAAATVPALLAMQAAGVDVIEVGVPFSDPMADGGTIQRANELALAGGVTLADCLAAVRAARAAGLTVPVVLMGYFNPLLRYGEARVVADAAAAGVDGFIVVDLPLEECRPFLAACDAASASGLCVASAAVTAGFRKTNMDETARTMRTARDSETVLAVARGRRGVVSP